MPKVLSVKIRETHNLNRVSIRSSAKRSPAEYKKRVNLKDSQQMGLLFLDLEMHGVDIEKAFKEYKKQKEEQFPW